MTETLVSERAETQTVSPLTGDALRHALEALLFVACEPLTAAALAKVLEVPEAAVEEAAEALSLEYTERGIVLRKVAGGYQFVTPDSYAPLVEKLYRPKFQQLSTAAMETLAIIAYKQPITRAEVSAIRQVESDSPINTLLEKRLICEVGRVNSAGRAILYGTGEEFLRFFGLNSLADLPDLGADGTGKEAFVL